MATKETHKSVCFLVRPEVASDVIMSGVAVDYVRMDVRVNIGDCRSNGSRDIRGADFVSNEHIEVYHVRQKHETTSVIND